MNHVLSAVTDHLSRIYPELDYQSIAREALQLMQLDADSKPCALHQNKWDQSDIWLITYGDSVMEPDRAPLKTLKRFADKNLKGAISGIHILPFFPYSSDEGFSVIDYSQVNDSLGDWQDIENISKDYDLMADLVINHCSQRSRWFENFRQRKDPGQDYFIEASPDEDLSSVVRPRTSPLLRDTQTLDGLKHVWCTFSHDQVDLNFANPKVFLEMVSILEGYLSKGVRAFRLDAIAFLWKEQGSECVHLPQTHEFVRLLRTLIEARSPESIIITETNVPNHENLSYFGNANEAHAVYNFSLPPLLLHALTAGTSEHLKRWQMSMPPAQDGTFFFNFIASHDGIGLRPAKGLLSEADIDELINTMQGFGGRISWRQVAGGKNEPYELNIALYDALQGTAAGPDKWQQRRFICAHTIMLALEGLPAFYIHSLLGTQNDYDRLKLTNHNRSINRRKWNYAEINEKLDDPNNHHSQVFDQLKHLIKLRAAQSAFHPNAVQFTLHLGDQVFAFWRQSSRRDQSIFCIHNVTDQEVSVPVQSINLIYGEDWRDLISGKALNSDLHELVLEPYQCVWLSNGAA